jgi:hypothetical protein
MNFAWLLPQKPACASLMPEPAQRKPFGQESVCGPRAPVWGFWLDRALTDFMATAHDAVGSATTPYRVPVCPWNFQLAPLTWPQSFPNAGGNPLVAVRRQSV